MPADELALARLRSGGVEVKGRMPWSSNGTFLVEVCADGAVDMAVYKPARGERPLWDFPSGLHKREVAAYVVSEALGWGLVPETIVRRDLPLGEGSLQRFVPADFEQHYFTLHEADREDWHRQLRRVCAFDLIINSCDRKSGHCLIDADGHIWAIDNGLSFHVEPKLRTVIWEYATEPIAADVLADVERFVAAGLSAELHQLLDRDEREALTGRAVDLLRARHFPIDPTGRRYPWPLV